MARTSGRGNRERTREGLIRTFPSISLVDLGKCEIEKSKISVANIQLETPDRFLSKSRPSRLTSEAEETQKEKIFRYLTEAIGRGADLIVLPELSTSKNICREIKEKFSTSQSIMVLGSYYDDYSYNLSCILVDGKFYGQMKNNPSPPEKDYMRRSGDVSLFINTPIGDFAVLICYDATDFSMLTALEGYTDFLICIARTKDVVTFRNIFNAMTYLQYQYVIFCNDAQFGGSSFYLPFHGRRRELDTLGIRNEDIIYREFDLKKLDEMRVLERERDDLFKFPPASSRPRHIPYVTREQRTREYFVSKSFNYLSIVRRHDILNSFLGHVNISMSLDVTGMGSIYRLEDVLKRSCRVMYTPSVKLSDFEPCDITLKYFLVDLVESLCQHDEKLLQEKTEIATRLSDVKGKQYVLFEIDIDKIRDALSTTPELIDEILRIRNIEKEKKLREIPQELRIEKKPIREKMWER